jgi:GNAT superfamily N-acetyltransferase
MSNSTNGLAADEAAGTAETEWRRGEFIISTDPARMDVDAVHRYLSEMTYWAKGVPKEVVARSLRHCLAFGVFHEPTGAQVGLARVITDRATFAYLSDVFIAPEYRGHGLSKWLMEVILAHRELQGLRRWLLFTNDAHSLYARFGFVEVPDPWRILQIHNPNVYSAPVAPPDAPTSDTP